MAVYFELIHNKLGLPELIEWQRLTIGVAVTTVGWIAVTFLTKPTEESTLRDFCRRVHPGGPGWKKVLNRAAEAGEDLGPAAAKAWDMPASLMGVFLGILSIYSILFTIGFWIYGNTLPALLTSMTAIISSALLIRTWRRLSILLK